MDDVVLRIKVMIYCIGFFAIVISLLSFIPKDKAQIRTEFWPPDLVPHPIPPWERPIDPNLEDYS